MLYVDTVSVIPTFLLLLNIGMFVNKSYNVSCICACRYDFWCNLFGV